MLSRTIAISMAILCASCRPVQIVNPSVDGTSSGLYELFFRECIQQVNYEYSKYLFRKDISRICGNIDNINCAQREDGKVSWTASAGGFPVLVTMTWPSSVGRSPEQRPGPPDKPLNCSIAVDEPLAANLRLATQLKDFGQLGFSPSGRSSESIYLDRFQEWLGPASPGEAPSTPKITLSHYIAPSRLAEKLPAELLPANRAALLARQAEQAKFPWELGFDANK
jgi:hypothetical protein